MARSRKISASRRSRGESAVHEAYSKLGQKGGKAVSEKYGPEFYHDIGKRGGQTRKRELGHEGYVELGHRGGKAVSKKYGPEFYHEIGKRGGEARKRGLMEGEM